MPLSYRICECLVPYFDSRSSGSCNVSLLHGCVIFTLRTLYVMTPPSNTAWELLSYSLLICSMMQDGWLFIPDTSIVQYLIFGLHSKLIGQLPSLSFLRQVSLSDCQVTSFSFLWLCLVLCMIWKASLSYAWYDGDIQLVACLVHDTLTWHWFQFKQQK